MKTVTKNGVTIYDGAQVQEFLAPEGETRALHIAVNRLGGSLSIRVVCEETGEAVYRGTEIPTSDFTVTLDEPGTYRAELSADHFQGSFDVSLTEQGGTQ